MTTVMFFAGTWGYLQLLRVPGPGGHPLALPVGGGSLLGNGSVLLAFAAVLATGVLAGVLAAVPRVSPLASGLPGLLLVGWTGLYLSSVRRATEIIPLRSHSFGAGWEVLLVNGVLGAAGLAMVVPMFVPSRWRGPQPAGEEDLEAMTREPDDYLADLKDDRGEQRRQGSRQSRPEISGRVLPGPTGQYRPGRTVGVTRSVDTTRVAGASRALRSTGPLRAATGPVKLVHEPQDDSGTGSFHTVGGITWTQRPDPSA
jgi:hypothetical protein